MTVGIRLHDDHQTGLAGLLLEGVDVRGKAVEVDFGPDAHAFVKGNLAR